MYHGILTLSIPHSSGLPFSYITRKNKNGDYSGEMVVSRKEDSKTLTRNSAMLAFRAVLEAMRRKGDVNGAVSFADDHSRTTVVLLECKDPKAPGHILGIPCVDYLKEHTHIYKNCCLASQ